MELLVIILTMSASSMSVRLLRHFLLFNGRASALLTNHINLDITSLNTDSFLWRKILI